MDFEKLEETGFEACGDERGLYALDRLTPEWDLFVRVGPSGRAGEIWLRNIYTDEEISIEKAPEAVYRKALKTLKEAGL